MGSASEQKQSMEMDMNCDYRHAIVIHKEKCMSKIPLRRWTFAALAMTLLLLSLLLAACGGGTAGNTGNLGNSNISNGGQTTTSQSTPANSSSNIQSINQQVQNGLQNVDNAQNDVDNADATATAASGPQQQP